VSVLDGGYGAWVGAGGATTRDVPTFAAKKLTLTPPRTDDVVDKNAVRALAARGDVVLVDVRAPERYRGETEPIDSRAGHIPGAKNIPWSRHVAAGEQDVQRLRTASEIRDLYASVGVGMGGGGADVVVYCGSGVTACLGLLALEMAGLGERARLYEGSWSDWSRDASLPAAVGDE
jgi:thiosulfate/3-mercaptopyruvate sulfurtransferase